MGVVTDIAQRIREFTDKMVASDSLRHIELKYPLMVSVYSDYDRVHCLICTIEFYASMEWIQSGANYCEVCRSRVAHTMGRRIQNFLYHCYASRD